MWFPGGIERQKSTKGWSDVERAYVEWKAMMGATVYAEKKQRRKKR